MTDEREREPEGERKGFLVEQVPGRRADLTGSWDRYESAATQGGR